MGGGKKEDIIKALGYLPADAKVNGINLLTGTKDFSGSWKINGFIKDGSQYNGFTVYKYQYEWGGIFQGFPVAEGETYTFSAYAKADKPMTLYIAPAYSRANDENYATAKTGSKAISVKTEWARYSMTFEISKSGNLYPHIEMPDTYRGTMYYVCGYKLEKGENPNPIWTPAPEDYIDLANRVAVLESKNGIVSADSAMELPSADMAENDLEVTE